MGEKFDALTEFQQEAVAMIATAEFFFRGGKTEPLDTPAEAREKQYRDFIEAAQERIAADPHRVADAEKKFAFFQEGEKTHQPGNRRPPKGGSRGR